MSPAIPPWLTKVPPSTVVSPVKLLLAVSVSVPPPVLVSDPLPDKTAAMVAPTPSAVSIPVGPSSASPEAASAPVMT